MNNLIYFHGFNSAGNGATSLLLKEALKDFNIISPTYPVHDPLESFISINTIINNVLAKLNNQDKLILAGTSMGGFWAKLFSNFLKIDAVIINPALHPGTQLEKYLGVNTNFSTNESYLFSDAFLYGYKIIQHLYSDNSNDQNIIAFLGTNDDLIDYKKSLRDLSGIRETIIIDGMGHRIEPYAISKITKAIYSLATN